jgi:hypothetical protein
VHDEISNLQLVEEIFKIMELIESEASGIKIGEPGDFDYLNVNNLMIDQCS